MRPENEFRRTGLLDARGNELYRVIKKRPIGFTVPRKICAPRHRFWSKRLIMELGVDRGNLSAMLAVRRRLLVRYRPSGYLSARSSPDSSLPWTSPSPLPPLRRPKICLLDTAAALQRDFGGARRISLARGGRGYGFILAKRSPPPPLSPQGEREKVPLSYRERGSFERPLAPRGE